MRILTFSGLHGNRALIDIFINSLIAKGLDVDIFVCAGDIGDSIIVELFEKMLQFGKPVLYVLGNHMLLDHKPGEAKKAQRFPNVLHLEKGSVAFDGLTFIGQDAWDHFTDEKKLDKRRYKDLLKKFSKASNGKTVLVTHHAPSGIYDRGRSYPWRSWKDDNGNFHGGSFSIRRIAEEFNPTIHIFAHCHSDGGKWKLVKSTLFVNVCHLERKTRAQEIGVNGSFMIVDTDRMICVPYHLSGTSRQTCTCGAIHYLNYRKCINCYEKGNPVINFSEIDDNSNGPSLL